MELMEVLSTRRSIRSYTSEPIGRPVLERLIRTATLAPSGMNIQPWAFCVIEGAERLCALSVRAKQAMLAVVEKAPTLAARYRERLQDPAYNIFYGAPALVVVCDRPAAYDGTAGCVMAAHTLMLAARDVGLGTCWIGFAEPLLRQPEVKTEFGIPADYRVVAPIIVGHPAASPDATPRNEPEILHWG